MICAAVLTQIMSVTDRQTDIIIVIIIIKNCSAPITNKLRTAVHYRKTEWPLGGCSAWSSWYTDT